ncbi:type II secretion system F family protein [Rubrobacter indicoceani]|uniref:type II secretion system F family protein n=1 Tax=Rubrobacter indicoceani TaxID=2051957 RepID=UPI000E5B7327|nr:type II secretion system F family protein [Rubrobacter indicoceani]
MSVFTYRARDRRGQVHEDTIEGNDVATVAATLRSEGLLVIDVKEQNVGQKDILEPFKTVKLGDLVVFTRQFATMINAGLPIVRALRALTDQTQNKKLRDALDAIRSDVESGYSLSEAMARHPEIFSKLYIEMVRAGEVGGVLDTVLLRVATQLEKDQELRRKVKSAMTYPTVVLILALVTGAAMLIFIVPIFARMFTDLGGVLPLPTRIAIGISDLLTSIFGIIFGLAAIGGVVFFLRWIKTENGRKVWGRIVLKIPAKIGDIVQKGAMARFARTLSSLGSAGVPILQALEITANASGNYVIESALLRSRDAIKEGRPLYLPLEEEPVFPTMVTRMLAVGEETGETEEMLEKIADFYESEVDASVKALTSIIEPLMIVVVGGIVGGIIIAMYLPMFKIFELIE